MEVAGLDALRPFDAAGPMPAAPADIFAALLAAMAAGTANGESPMLEQAQPMDAANAAPALSPMEYAPRAALPVMLPAAAPPVVAEAITAREDAPEQNVLPPATPILAEDPAKPARPAVSAIAPQAAAMPEPAVNVPQGTPASDAGDAEPPPTPEAVIAAKPPKLSTRDTAEEPTASTPKPALAAVIAVVPPPQAPAAALPAAPSAEAEQPEQAEAVAPAQARTAPRGPQPSAEKPAANPRPASDARAEPRAPKDDAPRFDHALKAAMPDTQETAELRDARPADQPQRAEPVARTDAAPRAEPAAKPENIHRSETPRPLPPIQQIATSLTRASLDGVERLTLQLSPAELGRLDIQLDMSGDSRAHVTVRADNAATLDLLQRDARNLERALESAGLRLESGGLDFALGRHDRDARPFAQNGASDPTHPGLPEGKAELPIPVALSQRGLVDLTI